MVGTKMDMCAPLILWILLVGRVDTHCSPEVGATSDRTVYVCTDSEVKTSPVFIDTSRAPTYTAYMCSCAFDFTFDTELTVSYVGGSANMEISFYIYINGRNQSFDRSNINYVNVTYTDGFKIVYESYKNHTTSSACLKLRTQNDGANMSVICKAPSIGNIPTSPQTASTTTTYSTVSSTTEISSFMNPQNDQDGDTEGFPDSYRNCSTDHSSSQKESDKQGFAVSEFFIGLAVGVVLTATSVLLFVFLMRGRKTTRENKSRSRLEPRANADIPESASTRSNGAGADNSLAMPSQITQYEQLQTMNVNHCYAPLDDVETRTATNDNSYYNTQQF